MKYSRLLAILVLPFLLVGFSIWAAAQPVGLQSQSRILSSDPVTILLGQIGASSVRLFRAKDPWSWAAAGPYNSGTFAVREHQWCPGPTDRAWWYPYRATSTAPLRLHGWEDGENNCLVARDGITSATATFGEAVQMTVVWGMADKDTWALSGNIYFALFGSCVLRAQQEWPQLVVNFPGPGNSTNWFMVESQVTGSVRGSPQAVSPSIPKSSPIAGAAITARFISSPAGRPGGSTSPS